MENILYTRYASKELQKIFSPTYRLVTEREFWINVLCVQKALGLKISSKSINKYTRAKTVANFETIRKIENKTKHDVKAKIEAFNLAAGGMEDIHKGMTSRDLTDNVDLIIMRAALRCIRNQYAQVLELLRQRSLEYKDLTLVARTHHQPAQITTVGKRFSMWAEELLHALQFLDFVIAHIPFRGIKGAIGSQQDQVSLLGEKKAAVLDARIAKKYGFFNVSIAVGQVYSRSLDTQIIASLSLLTSSIESFAKTMRLMSGLGLATEGFSKDQVGSSAMPHKKNTRNCERICSLSELLKGYVSSALHISGDQWEEGDVSCSAIRRVIIPDALFTCDGIASTAKFVLTHLSFDEKNIKKELSSFAVQLSSTKVLILLVKKGLGREYAHEAIKGAVLESTSAEDFVELLRRDKKIASVCSRTEVLTVLSERSLGRTNEQISQVANTIRKYLGKMRVHVDDIL